MSAVRTRCARCRGIGWINENSHSTDSSRCPDCLGVGTCEHDWRKVENPYGDDHRFKCTRCGKVEYVERAD